jgi:hypothetical protein
VDERLKTNLAMWNEVVRVHANSKAVFDQGEQAEIVEG